MDSPNFTLLITRDLSVKYEKFQAASKLTCNASLLKFGVSVGSGKHRRSMPLLVPLKTAVLQLLRQITHRA